MIINPASEQIPIRADEYGRLRAGTPACCSIRIYAYWRGETPKPSRTAILRLAGCSIWRLATTYGIAEIDAYLREQGAGRGTPARR